MNKKFVLKSKKSEEKFKLFEKATKYSTAFGGTKLEVLNNKQATVDGCKGVVEYYDSVIKLNIGNGTVSFFGNNLHIVSFESGVVELTGKIETIEYFV